MGGGWGVRAAGWGGVGWVGVRFWWLGWGVQGFRVSWLGGTAAGCQALRLRGFEGPEIQGFRVAAFGVFKV